MCGGTEDDARDAAEFKAADLGEYVDAVLRVGLIDGERMSHNLHFVMQTLIRDICPAPCDLLRGEAEDGGGDGGTRCCVRDSHLAGQNAAVAACSTVRRETDPRLDCLYCLCVRHGSTLGHVCRPACNAAVKQVGDSRRVGIDAEIGNAETGGDVVGDGVCRAASCHQIVAHHVQRRLRRVRTDALCSNTVISTGDDDTRLWWGRMTFTRQCNIACEGIAELPEMNPAARAERSGHAAGERSIGHGDGGDGLL